MKNIIFICTGNTCRSVIAHKLFEKMLEESGKRAKIYSAGMYANTRDGATINAVQALKEYNIELKDYRSVHIKDINMEEMDLILCMTLGHKGMMGQLYPNLKDNIYTLKEYVENDKEGKDIKDPFGNSKELYILCLKEIKENLEKLINLI